MFITDAMQCVQEMLDACTDWDAESEGYRSLFFDFLDAAAAPDACLTTRAEVEVWLHRRLAEARARHRDATSDPDGRDDPVFVSGRIHACHALLLLCHGWDGP